MKATPREISEKKEKGNYIPAILYGPKIKNLPLVVLDKEFMKIFKQAGESTLINLEVEGQKNKFLVLIHDFQSDALSHQITHIDFYQPDLEKKVIAHLPLIIEGESPAVKNLGATIVQNINEVEVRALPLNLPRDIKINIAGLNAFEDVIRVEDLIIPEGVEVLKDPQGILITVSPPQKVEEDLAKPVEEEMKEPELIKKKEKEEEEKEEEMDSGAPKKEK